MATGETEQGAVCWASLPAELTGLIAAGGFLDYVRFRAVCSPWRAAAPCPRGRGVLDPRLHPDGGGRWMMFPEGFGHFPGHRALGGHARFLDLSAAGAFVRVPLPLLRDHCVLDAPDGLLLLQRDGDTAVRLLHPFTGDVAEFPHLDSLAHQLHCLDLEPTVDPMYNFTRWMYNTSRLSHQVRKVCATVDVADGGIVTVMLALEKIGRVAFAAAGDDNWVISTWKENQLDNTLSFQGKLYVVNCRDGLIHVSVIYPPPPQREREGEKSVAQPVPPPRRVATCSSEETYLPSLVEFGSELMLVGYNDNSLSRILVLRLADLAMGMTVHW